MLELGSSGSMRGVSSNGHPYRDPRWFADIRTEFLHELKWCRQIPAVAVYRPRAANFIIVDPHQVKRYILVTKEVDFRQM